MNPPRILSIHGTTLSKHISAMNGLLANGYSLNQLPPLQEWARHGLKELTYGQPAISWNATPLGSTILKSMDMVGKAEFRFGFAHYDLYFAASKASSMYGGELLTWANVQGRQRSDGDAWAKAIYRLFDEHEWRMASEYPDEASALFEAGTYRYWLPPLPQETKENGGLGGRSNVVALNDYRTR